MSLRHFALAAFLIPAAAQAVTAQHLAGLHLKKLRDACDSPQAYVVRQLTELRGLVAPKDWQIFSALNEVTWTEFVHVPACKTAMLENTVEGMRFVIDEESPKSAWVNDAREAAAKALLLLAVTDEPAKRDDRLARAATLQKQFLEGVKQTNKAEDIARAMGYYFVASDYLAVAREARRPADIDAMLTKALETARAGVRHATDTSHIVEPYGIALAQIAKRVPKGSAKWRKTIEESITAYAHNRDTDPWARYNIAFDHVLLDDMPSAHKELEAMADAGQINDQVCVGLVTDRDLQPLRDADMDWFRSMSANHCQPTVQRLMRQRSAGQ